MGNMDSRVKYVFVAVAIIALVALFVFFALRMSDQERYNVGDRTITQENILSQNQRAFTFLDMEPSEEDERWMTESRVMLLDVAERNGISVSQAEVNERLNELGSQEGMEGVLSARDWSKEDQEAVIWWGILREKVISRAEPSRSGEIFSIRWDRGPGAFIDIDPEVMQLPGDEAMEIIAPEREPRAREYLENLEAQLKSGRLKDLYEVSEEFNVVQEPAFNGYDHAYSLQYRGWDEQEQSYYEFPDADRHDFLFVMEPPAVSSVQCSLGGCRLYNVVEGHDGIEDSEDVVNTLTDERFPF